MSKNSFFYLILYIIQNYTINSNSIFDYSHEKGEPLKILAGSLSSKESIIPYGYTKLNICQSKKIVKEEDTLGEILTGELFYTTDFIVKTDQDSYCQVLCYNNFSEKSISLIQKLIHRNYFTNWIIDKLPAGLIYYNKKTKQSYLEYSKGVPLGFIKDHKFYIYNHLQFHILLNEIDENQYNVVGINIFPMSIKHNGETQICVKQKQKIMDNLELPEQPLEEGDILFTYDVIFEYSDVTLASRWDHYKVSKANIHWAGIIISEIIVFSISVIIIIILCKNLNSDISLYNYRISRFEDIQEYDWKQISGDVFRPPSVNPLLLSSLLGTGIQLFLMMAGTLVFGVFGYVNPEQRKNILNLGILFYCFMGLPGGYFSALFYKLWGGKNWFKASLLTSLIFPGTLLFGYIIVNIILTIEKSNAAVEFLDILSLFILWIFCTFPLILLGSFLGSKSRIYIPCTINRIPSDIPKKPWYLHYKYITFITGFIGFGTIFIEFNYVMSSLWNHEIYLLATYLWVSFLLFVIVSAEMSIIFVFFNLCWGDHNWWWKSFIMGGSPVIYFVLYSIYYFFYLRIVRISAMVVYFGMMGLICVMVLFICGSISVLFNFTFIEFIYSKIRRD